MVKGESPSEYYCCGVVLEKGIGFDEMHIRKRPWIRKLTGSVGTKVRVSKLV